MGFGSFFDTSSSSSSTDARVGAADQGVVTQGKGTASARDMGKALGAGAKLLEKNAVDVSGNKGTINSGLQVSTKGNVVINDTAPIASLASQFADTLKAITSQESDLLQNITSKSSDALTSALSQQSSQASDALGKVSDLSANAQTGGDTDRNKIILYVVLGVLALLGVVFYVKR